jgi:hypothetical protein
MSVRLAFMLCACALAANGVACAEDPEGGDSESAARAAESQAPNEPAVDPGPSVVEIRRARRERRERAVEGAVRDFYREVDFGQYESAWVRLTPAVQSALGGFEAWRGGYEFSVSTRVSNVTAVEARPRSAVVLFKLRSEDIDECANDVVQRFSGRWELARVGPHWRATSIGAEKVAGATPVTSVEDCPGYGEELEGIPPAEVPNYEPPNYAPPDDYSYEEDAYSDPDYGYDPEYDYNPEYDYGPPTTEDFGSGQEASDYARTARLAIRSAARAPARITAGWRNSGGPRVNGASRRASVQQPPARLAGRASHAVRAARARPPRSAHPRSPRPAPARSARRTARPPRRSAS